MQIKFYLKSPGLIQARARFMKGKKPVRAYAQVKRTENGKADIALVLNSIADRAEELGIAPQDTQGLRGAPK